MKEKTNTAASFAAIESLNRLAHYGRDVLRLGDGALANLLHDFNDRNALGLSPEFVDEFAWTISTAKVAA